ncbi:glycosyltransferase family 92 protein F13G3.3-like [Clarias gariepinus]
MEPTCNATHITISRPENLLEIQSHLYLPIRKLLTHERDFDVDFTLCISSMFGGYNNVLQFVQTVETYKLLGVEHMIIYNTSCGPDLEKVLHIYEQDGFLEIIPWPIHHFLEPSKGWNFEQHSGELHYYGQQATINDCIHRNRQRSKYVILTDADEIIMPYQHSSLQQLMTELQKNNPHVVAFIFWAHVFSQKVYEVSERFNIPQWRHVPGVNILRHIHREPLKWFVNNNSKMIVDPRKVMQASVHNVYKISGKSIWVPSGLAIVMHTTRPHRPDLGAEKLIMDNKIWEYAERLIPNVNKVMHKSGILK